MRATTETARKEIPAAIATAAVRLLEPYCQDLTAERLLAAVIYRPEPEEKLEKMLTRRETAQALGVSLPTVDRMLRDGNLPKRRIRGAVRIPSSAISNIVLKGVYHE
jgi:excisionase family DNA binding protein